MSKKQQKHEFTIGGQTVRVSKEEAEYKFCTIKNLEEPKKYYVRFKGREYPVNQAVEAFALNLMRTDIQTQHANQILKRLGFKVRQK